MSCRSALSALSRASDLTRCKVSTSSRTTNSPVPGVPQHGEQPLQEPECPEVVEVAAYSGGPAGGGRDVGLPAEPREDGRGRRFVLLGGAR